MELKNWLTKKTIDYQAKQATSLTDAIDRVLIMKAEKLRKKGKVVDKDSLMSSYKALAILGITKEMVEERVESYLAETNLSTV